MRKIKAYILLDSGFCKKLAQVGEYRIIRPALNAFWKPSLPETEWLKADAIFERESSGGGIWSWAHGRNPGSNTEWTVRWGDVNLNIKPTAFGHLGFFAEQARNWQWLRDCIGKMNFHPQTLNLFAYSGGATIAMAQAGAEVCHLDASKGIIEWAKKNQMLNPETDRHIRWICDDAMKFAAREERRGHRYNGIVLDPPSFGRGAQGQVWKIEEGLADLLDSCKKILDTRQPFFILLSCHSQGFSATSLGRILSEVFPEQKDCVDAGEMLIPEHSGNFLPAGLYARIFWHPGKNFKNADRA